MSDSEIIIFPGVRIESPKKGETVTVRLEGQDLAALVAFAKTLGCSLNDAAGRKLRYALRQPPEGGAA